MPPCLTFCWERCGGGAKIRVKALLKAIREDWIQGKKSFGDIVVWLERHRSPFLSMEVEVNDREIGSSFDLSEKLENHPRLRSYSLETESFSEKIRLEKDTVVRQMYWTVEPKCAGGFSIQVAFFEFSPSQSIVEPHALNLHVIHLTRHGFVPPHLNQRQEQQKKTKTSLVVPIIS